MSRATDRAAIAAAADSILAAVQAGVHFNLCHDLLRESALACRNLLSDPEMYTDHQLGVFVREAARGEGIFRGVHAVEAVAASGLVTAVGYLAASALLQRGAAEVRA